jgi:hypothetical protein
MADKPILFSGPMVRALLAGTKTQTRRIVPKQPALRPDGLWDHNGYEYGIVAADDASLALWLTDFQRIEAGDRLWVRETFKPIPAARPGGYFVEGSPFFGQDFFYQADGNCPLWADGKWKPSIHLPRAASRLTLTVTDVRVQRLQDISEEDAIAEGIERIGRAFGGPDLYRDYGQEKFPHIEATGSYRTLWDSINGPGSWQANPWIAAYTFTVERENIDQLARAS